MEVKRIEKLTEIDIKKWDDFIQKNSYGNYFQSKSSYLFFEKIENYMPILIIANDSESIRGSILATKIKDKGIKGFFSKRCIIWGGPVIDDNLKEKEQIASQLIMHLDKSHNAIYTEFRNFNDTKNIKQAFIFNGYTFNEHLNYLVEVGNNEDESLKLLNSSKRRQVKKSLKEGSRIEVAKSINQVNKFYDILKELYKTKIKKPLPSLQFFEEFFNQQSGVYLLIYKDDELLGGIMCPLDNTTIYEWYICGLDGKYKNIYPSVLATWASIAYASKNNLKYFDFLGAGSPNKDYGVREFKSKFGGQLVNYGRYKKINKPLFYQIGLLGLRILSSLK